MLIDVLHLLEDAGNQSNAVIEYIDANMAFFNGQDYNPVVTLNRWTLPWRMNDGVKEFHLVAEPVVHKMAPGFKAHLQGYNGQSSGSTIEVVEGDKVRILGVLIAIIVAIFKDSFVSDPEKIGKYKGLFNLTRTRFGTRLGHWRQASRMQSLNTGFGKTDFNSF